MELPQHGPAPVRAIDDLPGIDRLEPLDAYQGQVLDLVRSRLADGVDVLDVSGAVADANDALTRRLLMLAEAHLGPPAWRYRWLALGSHGRREQVLSSDQDHAIAYEVPLAADAEAAYDYFAALAREVVPALARAGLRLCSGGYMATHWCHPLDEYELMFRGWVSDPQPRALLEAEVFLDVRACHGDLPTDVLERILLTGGSRGPFRVQMARAAVEFRPPSSWLRRWRAALPAADVKLGGTAAIVLLARLYALSAGSTEHSTVARLQAAAAAGTLNSSTSESLIEAYRFLTELRLRHQVEQVTTGLPTDNLIPVDRLTHEQRRRLRTVLRLVRNVQDVTAMRYPISSVT